MVIRFILLISAPFLAYGLIIFNLYDLQVLGNGGGAQRAGSDYLALRYLKANRGVIYFTDKDGDLLPAAMNKNFPSIYAVPSAITDAAEAANNLAPVFWKSVEDLEKIFSNKEDSYELLAKKADEELVDKVSSLDIEGIYVEQVPERFYPLEKTAAHLLGFVGPKSEEIGEVGKYGLEAFYEGELSGEHGKISEGGEVQKPEPGEDLVLTIDPNIQIEAERIIASLVKRFEAKGGSVIVMEPKTGKILAMGSVPDFDPNNYGEFPIAAFLNPVVQEIYEPGSVFKVLTMSAGIDSEKITPATTYYDSGKLTLNGRTIENYDLKTHGPYGRATMMNVIEHSINTGAVFAQRETGRELFTEYMHKFGFSEKTGVDMPGELRGDLRRLSPAERDIAFATASYGQGVATTAMEMINSFAAIANSGVLMRPYLNAALAPQNIRRVIGIETARQVTEMMISAVDKADVAEIKGYTVAGKTGTAYVPDFKYGGYTDNVINTYIGFAPACVGNSAGRPTCEPRFVALIKLNEPKGAPVSALTVVPAFRDLAQFILNYYGVEPDRI